MDRYLPIIVKRCLEGEAQWSTYIMLVDRNLRAKGHPQHYGTQYEFIDKEKTMMVMAPMDNLQLVNQRRVKLGLNPIVEEVVSRIQNIVPR